MLRVSRPAAGTLVISQGRAQAFVRLAIWIGVVGLFYLVVLGETVLSGAPAANGRGVPWHEWALLLFPLSLLPYLFSLVRTLRRADELILDGREKIVSRGRRTLAVFTDIRSLELKTVHGSCEEFRLSAILSNGRSIELMETEASAAIGTLAREMSGLLQVPLIRKA
ncbi:MAG TPA: hypothetical protein VLS27_17735 [Gammaproteobacteria bacterium]|nr:hypothetical protein [Gammaproteobacteria bacterium]